MVDNGGAALQVTTESGATVLAEVVPPAVEGGRWTLIEMHPTGMRKPSSQGSCHEALRRAVEHALSRAGRG